MNTYNRLGIWISKQDQISHVDNILSKYNNLDDIFLISDLPSLQSKYAIIPSYYIAFQNIEIVFLNLQDLVANKNYIRSKNISLFCDPSDIVTSKLDRTFFQDIKVIEL